MKSFIRNTLMSIALLAIGAPGASLAGPKDKALKPGKIKLVGKYERKKFKEGKKDKTYFQVKAGKAIRLRVGGPASIELLAQSDKKVRAAFVIKLDGGKSKRAKLTVGSDVARGIHVKVPEGTHLLSVKSSKGIWLRPKRTKKGPKRGQPVVAWKAKAAPRVAAAPKAKPPKAKPPKAKPPKAKPPKAKPPKAKPPKAKPTGKAAKKPKPAPKPAAGGLPPPPPVPGDEKAKSVVKAKKPAPAPKPKPKPAPAPKIATAPKPAPAPKISTAPMLEGASVDLEGRPVEAHLRILADKLAAGLAKLPGQGRYEGVIVAKLAESGEATRDLELGTLVSARLSTLLQRDHNFLLLDRDRLADVLKEMELGMTGLLDPTKAAQAGKKIGAQAILVGTVAEAGADFSIDAQLISAETATVLAAESINVPRAGMVAMSEESVALLRTRSGAMWRSLVVPGWGQFYNREPVMGGIIIGLEVALAGAAVTMHFLGASDEDRYKNADESRKDLRQRAETYYQQRNILIYSAIGVYLYNVLDAYLSGIDGEKQLGLNVTPMAVSDVQGSPSPGVGLGFSY